MTEHEGQRQGEKTVLVERMTYSVEEVAILLGIGRQHAYNLAKANKLPGLIKLGNRYVVSKARIDRVVNGEQEERA